MSAIDDLLKEANKHGIRTDNKKETDDFATTAKNVVDSLVEQGFNRMEAISIFIGIVQGQNRR